MNKGWMGTWTTPPSVAIVVVAGAVSLGTGSPAVACTDPARCPVTLNQKELFFVEQAAPFSAAERAAQVSDRLLAVAKTAVPVDQIALVEQSNDLLNATLIATNPQDPKSVLMTVTNADAAAMDMNRRMLAEGHLQAIRSAIQDYRDSNRPAAATATRLAPAANAIGEPDRAAPRTASPLSWLDNLLGTLLSALLIVGLISCVPAFMNAIAGLFLRRRLQVGDRIMVNQTEVGRVDEIQPLSTRLLADDGLSVSLIPNSALFNQYIVRSTPTPRPPAGDRPTQTLTFKLRMDSPAPVEDLEACLRGGLPRLPDVAWGALTPAERADHYELTLIRSPKPIAKNRVAFSQDVVRVLGDACDRQGLDVYLKPMSAAAVSR